MRLILSDYIKLPVSVVKDSVVITYITAWVVLLVGLRHQLNA